MPITTITSLKKTVVTAASMATAAFYRRGADFLIACSNSTAVVQHRKTPSSSSSSQVSSSFRSADYSEKRRRIEEFYTIDEYKIEDVIPGCGNVFDYEKLDAISSGAYGVVYRVCDTRSGEIAAIKVETNGLSVASLREIEILRSLPRHRNVVELKEVAGNGGNGVYVVMEYVEYDLKRYMAVKELSLREIKYLMKELLEGVKFLHDNMVMHRDIKPTNILVDGSGESLKICDFGFSRRMEAAGCCHYSTRVGTLAYKAPELLLGRKGYSTAVDMWAVGCTMAELLLKRALFGGQKTELAQIRRIYRILGPPGFEVCNVLQKEFGGGGGGAPMLTEVGFDLLKKLLSCDPKKRITAEAALHHAWFNEE